MLNVLYFSWGQFVDTKPGGVVQGDVPLEATQGKKALRLVSEGRHP